MDRMGDLPRQQESAPGGPAEPIDPASIVTLEELLLDHETGQVGDGLRGVQGRGVSG